MARRFVILLADGFEEIEATGTIDVLRRAELDVTVASVDGIECVRGSHGLMIGTDGKVSDLTSEELALVAMPGGMPGSRHLAENDMVLELLKRVYANGNYLAAICAAPLALHAAGLIEGKTVTAYPKVKDELTGCTVTANPVEQHDRIITGKGPGAVFAFALQIVTEFCGNEKAETLRTGMVIPDETAM